MIFGWRKSCEMYTAFLGIARSVKVIVSVYVRVCFLAFTSLRSLAKGLYRVVFSKALIASGFHLYRFPTMISTFCARLIATFIRLLSATNPGLSLRSLSEGFVIK